MATTDPKGEGQPMEVVSRRVFAAPREAVFGAFSDPEQLRLWWGPKGFTNEFKVFEFRPGGAWRFVMRGPDGKAFDNAKDFVEIVPLSRIVFLHLGTMHKFRMTMTFEPHAGGGTELTWRMEFEPDVQNKNLRSFVVEANEQNFDRLEAHLASRA